MTRQAPDQHLVHHPHRGAEPDDRTRFEPEERAGRQTAVVRDYGHDQCAEAEQKTHVHGRVSNEGPDKRPSDRFGTDLLHQAR